SALAKRYVPEPGTGTVNYLFSRFPADRMIVLTVGVAEVVSVFTRRRNAGVLPPTEFTQAMSNFQTEVITPRPPFKVTVGDRLGTAATPLIQTHPINGTDALALRSSLDLARQFRMKGDDLILVASDLRLLRAAQAEGLITFDPEQQSQADLDAIL